MFVPTCYTCGVKGHISPHCPQKRQRTASSRGPQAGPTSATASAQRPAVRNDYSTCFTCGQKGH